MDLNKKYAVLTFFLALLLVPIGRSATIERCVDNATLVKNTTYEFYISDAKILNFTLGIPQVCDYGCDSVTNSCSPSQLSLTVWIVIGIFAFLVTIGIIRKVWG